MRQQTFAEGTFEIYVKPTRPAAFLAEMERVASGKTPEINPKSCR